MLIRNVESHRKRWLSLILLPFVMHKAHPRSTFVQRRVITQNKFWVRFEHSASFFPTSVLQLWFSYNRLPTASIALRRLSSRFNGIGGFPREALTINTKGGFKILILPNSSLKYSVILPYYLRFCLDLRQN